VTKEISLTIGWLSVTQIAGCGDMAWSRDHVWCDNMPESLGPMWQTTVTPSWT